MTEDSKERDEFDKILDQIYRGDPVQLHPHDILTLYFIHADMLIVNMYMLTALRRSNALTEEETADLRGRLERFDSRNDAWLKQIAERQGQ